MSTRFSVGQMNQLGDALETAGFSADEVTKLRTFPGLADIRRVLLGQAEIKPVEHLIDLDAAPFVPEGWQVVEHKKGGQWKWDSNAVQLYLSDGQKDGKYVKGDKLREEIKGKPVLNANVLDYLLAHPELIPEDWKKDEKGNTLFIHFWGIIYRDPLGGLCVRCLDWHGSRWLWDCDWLGGGWGSGDPVALLASA